MAADPRDQLPEPLRHAVDQTVAAERLEGWQPSPEHLSDLVRLARDEVGFGDYLAAHRARYPTAARGQARTYGLVFRRGGPYLIAGTTLLRNNFGAETHDMLQDLEYIATAGRILQWHRRLIDGGVGVDAVDVRMLHRHAFADVYPWAGNYRSIELRRGDTLFVPQSAVVHAMTRIEAGARQPAATGVQLDTASLSYELARLYTDYNYVHPFREGNGRTGTLLLHTVASLCGRRLDLTSVTRQQWYAASRDSAPAGRDGQADHRPFLPLFARALR